MVWDDSVAPETCIDLDAQHVSSDDALTMWAAGLAFFAALYTIIAVSDVPSRSPVARKINVLSVQGIKYDLGQSDETGDEEHDE